MPFFLHLSIISFGLPNDVIIKSTFNFKQAFNCCSSFIFDLLAIKLIPNPLEFDEEGTEFLPATLFGDYEKLFLALLIDRLHRDGLEPDAKDKNGQIELNRMLRAHLNRGIYSLTSRLQGLDGFNEMVKAEQKYD